MKNAYAFKWLLLKNTTNDILRSLAAHDAIWTDPLFFRCIFSEWGPSTTSAEAQPDAGPGDSLGAGADEPFSDGTTALGAVA